MRRGQGATEYLVLLAVVLIIALVGVALLGFFPGTANDAQIQESDIYWQSATPIAITDSVVHGWVNGASLNFPYLKVRNTGGYPVRITKLLGDSGQEISRIGVNGTALQMSDYYYMAPGEERDFGWNTVYPNRPDSRIDFYSASGSSSAFSLYGFVSGCSNSTSPPWGTLSGKLGFEYIQYVEGQQIVKRQIGAKPLMIPCSERR